MIVVLAVALNKAHFLSDITKLSFSFFQQWQIVHNIYQFGFSVFWIRAKCCYGLWKTSLAVSKARSHIKISLLCNYSHLRKQISFCLGNKLWLFKLYAPFHLQVRKCLYLWRFQKPGFESSDRYSLLKV